MNLARIFRHLFSEGSARRDFPPRVLDAIHRAIVAGEHLHSGEVMFAAHGALPWNALWRGRSAHESAQEAFAHLRVWDTQQNNGVLIYVLLADRAIEIVADRGVEPKVDDAQWEAICTRMQQRFAAREFEQGAIEGVMAVSRLLAQHFPAQGARPANELPDRPVVR
jgi:uncharacterized membrane protein